MNFDTATCLICNSYYDRKPFRSECGQAPTGDGEALKIFFKLLCGGNEVGGCFGEREELPCCGQCDMALVDLVRLQRIIEEAQEKQQELLDSLKGAVLENKERHRCQLDDKWMPVRNQLLQTLVREDVRNDEQLGSVEETGFYQEEDDNDNDRYFEEDEDAVSNSSQVSYVLPDGNEDDPLGDEEDEPPQKKKRGRPRKQVLNPRPTSTEPSELELMAKIKPCSILLERVRAEDFNISNPARLKSQPEVLKRKRVVGRPEKRRSRVVKPGWKRGEGEVNFINVFYSITDTMLLFKTTPIQYSAEGFTCLGPDLNCGHFVPGSDYFTFQNMRDHVNQSHGEDRKQECPICRRVFKTGNRFGFREHILAKHSPSKNRLGTKSTVVCESCWKPMPYHCILYHVWHHKNQTEQAALLASGGKIDPKIKIKLGLAKKPQDREREAEQDLEGISSSVKRDKLDPGVQKSTRDSFTTQPNPKRPKVLKKRAVEYPNKRRPRIVKPGCCCSRYALVHQK